MEATQQEPTNDVAAVMRCVFVSVLLSFTSMVVGSVTSRAQTFQNLGNIPGGSSARSFGVNTDGSVVVGVSFIANSPRAFRWSAATGMVNLGVLPGFSSSEARGVNADGSVVIGFNAAGTNNSQAFRWKAATGMVSLGALPGHDASRATGVSADGEVVVGFSFLSSSPQEVQAFRWRTSTGMIGLGTLSGHNASQASGVSADGVVIVGDSFTVGAVNTRAFRWSASTGMVDIGVPQCDSGCSVVHASGVSGDGNVIVGWGTTSFSVSQTRAFRWTVTTGPVVISSAEASLANATNADGSVIVGCNGFLHLGCQNYAFRWTPTGGIEKISDLLAAYGVDSGPLSTAWSVSADGTAIAGDSWLAVIPVSAHLPALQVIPATNMTASGVQGGPFSPSSFNYSVSASVGSISYSISGVPTWLTASVTSGTATTSGTTVTFSTNANTNTLPVGTNTATLNFANIDTGRGTQQRTAIITVTAGPPTSIFAAVAPNARTTAVGVAVTGFATILNAGVNTATGCSIGLPNGVPATFFYQTTDPATNQPVGTGNTPATIPSGKAQTYYFAVTPTQVMSQEMELVFSCGNSGTAPVARGLNTFLVTASSTPVADMLTIADTFSHDGIIVIPNSMDTGLMVIASIDIRASGTVTFTPTDTPFGQLPRNLPLTLSICETNPSTGVCTNPTIPGSSSTVTVASDQTVYFSIFVQGQGTAIPFDPANNRIFVIATQAATPVGEASAAVKMQ